MKEQAKTQQRWTKQLQSNNHTTTTIAIYAKATKERCITSSKRSKKATEYHKETQKSTA